jgi:hypothetical protein
VGAGRAALRWSIRFVFALLVTAIAVGKAFANEAGPLFPVTSAPGGPLPDATCTLSGGGCHEKFEPNSGPGEFTIIAPLGYTPGETYMIEIDLAQEGQLRWGFQMTAIDAELAAAGTFAPTDANTQVQDFSVFGSDRSYIAHTLVGTAAGQPNANSWNVEWTAPSTDVGPVTFYASGNAADNSVTAALSDDYIYTESLTISAAEPGSLAGGLLGLSAAAALARWKDRPRWKGRARGVA